MRLIRFLILMAIVVLVAMYFISQPEDYDIQQDFMLSIRQPFDHMKQMADKVFPALKSEIEKLYSDIQERMETIEPDDYIPFKAPSSSSSNAPYISDVVDTSESGKSSQNESKTLPDDVEQSIQQLRRMNADDLAERMKELYRQLQKHVEPTPTPTP